MNPQDSDSASEARVVLYLALMLPIVLSACGGMYFLSYAFTPARASQPPPLGIDVAWPFLIVISALINAAGGLFSGMISNLMYDRAGQSPPRMKGVIFLATCIAFILSVVGGIFIAFAQTGP